MRFSFCFIHTTGNFSSSHKCFNHHLSTFGKCKCNGRLNLFNAFYFGDSKATSTYIRFYKTRKTYFLSHLFVRNSLSGTQYQRLRNFYAKALKILITGKFIECNSCSQHATTRIRQSYQIEIALKNTVFARRTMNGDICKIEVGFYAVSGKAEIIFIDGYFLSIRPFHLPRLTYNGYNE